MKFVLIAAAALAIPFQDKHTTQVKVVPLPPTPDSSHFLIQVSRLDLLTDKNDVKALKSQVMLLALDVSLKDNVLLLNNQPIGMGISNLQLASKTTIGTIDGFKEEEALKNLDTGIVDVEIHAKGVEVEKDGIVIREIVLEEVVTAVNGQQVEISDSVQQLIQVFPDGHVSCHPPIAKPVMGGEMAPSNMQVMPKKEMAMPHKMVPKEGHVSKHHKLVMGERLPMESTTTHLVQKPCKAKVAYILGLSAIAFATLLGLFMFVKRIVTFFTVYEPVAVEDQKMEFKSEKADDVVEKGEALPPYDPEFKA